MLPRLAARRCQHMQERPSPDSTELRARLAADIASGKTIALSAEDLARPDVRHRLPELLENLARSQLAHPTSSFHIPGYTLLGEIGHGGMSTVHLARHHALGRHVALKIAPKWLAGDKRMQQRLLQEARAMARVSHAHIVAIHDILEIDDTVAIAMDWIDGLTLAGVLRALPAQPHANDVHTMQAALGTAEGQVLAENATAFFVRTLRDIALAVHRVHAANLLHLDIKPSNILVRRDGIALLADFGVVREIDLASTHTRTFAGTPVYAAPEQLQREDAKFGPHTDVYGLGMTLYEVLARRQPLHQLGLTRVLQDIVGGRIPALSSQVAIAPDLENIVHKAIAPEQHNRYANAEALADDLTAFLDHRPVAARKLSTTQRLRRWARNEPWIAALTAVTLVTVPAVVGLGAYVWWQMPRIEQSLLEDRQAQVNGLKQASFQAYFINQNINGSSTRTLEEAMAIDPGASSLVCLLAMAHEEAEPLAAQTLALHAATVEKSLGLRLFATKVRERRPFFTDAEVGQLRTGTDDLDKYVLALDRVFWAEDRGHEEAYEAAEMSLDEAAMTTNADPLLFGLRAWVALRAGRQDSFAAVSRAVRNRWPGDIDLLAWLYLALEQVDAAAALAIAKEIQDAHPRHARGYELSVGEAFRARRFDEALRRLDQAPAGVTSRELETLRALSVAHSSDSAAADQILAQLPPDDLSVSRKLRLLRHINSERVDRERSQLLAGAPTSPLVIKALFRDARATKDADHVEQAWQLWCKHHPARVALHDTRCGDLWAQRDLHGAAKLARELVVPRAATANRWRLFCSTFTTAGDWEALDACARRWLSLANEGSRPESNYYLALAELRTDRSDSAAPRLTAAISAPSPLQWYGHALLEDAWLRVEPTATAARRDPALAKARIAAFDDIAKKSPRAFNGPWTQLVRAEVAFANGDRATAMTTAERGLRLREAEPHAPANWESLLRSAIERYRTP